MSTVDSDCENTLTARGAFFEASSLALQPFVEARPYSDERLEVGTIVIS